MIIKRKNILVFIMTIVIVFTLSYKASASILNTKRLAGTDRYQTSLKVAQDGWSSSYYAILASGEDYPDALSSVPLAKKYDAPILLTHKTYVDSYILDELKSLNVGKVFIIGGTGSVSDNVVNQLTALGMQIERIGGADRYDTSVKIAEKFGKVDTLTVATGQDYADAISIGPAAAAMGVPVLLVPKNIMPDGTKSYIQNLKNIINEDYKQKQLSRNVKVFVVGDNSVVSDNVAREFENTFTDDVTDQQFGDVERITGSDKYERNINVIARFLEKYSNTSNSNDNTKTKYSTKDDLFSMNNLYIASGDGFADALSGAAEAAKNKAPVILSGSSNSRIINDFILTKIPNYKGDSSIPEYLTALGGQIVLPNSRISDIFGDVFNDKNVSGGNSYPTAFGDSKLEKLIREKIGMPTGTLNYSDLKNITSLDLSNQGITDISGLENCTGLQSLDLSYNQIKDITPLLKLYDLKDLNLSHNEISDVSYLSNLTNLGELNLSDNNISNLGESRKDTKDSGDTNYSTISQSVFKYMTNLTSLDLSNSNGSYRNSISSSTLDNLQYLTKLTSLNLKGTNVGSLTNLEKLTNLATLNLSNTEVSSLDSLKNLNNLTYLDLSNDDSIDGDDLKPLQNLTGLKYLNLANDDVDKLTYLTGLTNLTTLYLEDNPISDYTPIMPYTNSLYYRDFDISSMSSDAAYSQDTAISDQVKNEIANLGSHYLKNNGTYNYSDYNKLRFRVLYHPYASGSYNDTLARLKEEKDWLNQKIILGGLSASELRNVNDDLSSVENKIADISKKDVMNTQAADLDNQLASSYNAKDMEKIVNKINYTYADYRYDYYRTLVDRCTNDIQSIEAQIQVIGLQGPGYGGSNTIDRLRNMLDQKKKDKDLASDKITMYDNYRNFFNAVNSVLEEY
ncbi:cell wall-binding repeat-containing protein [Clostridium ljungdahlii]|uniref:N-acetylmuramoyl-L-alanine amidase LytC n=1 Tax=Clostridium ljungdahlii TaxID=1538 RepID=A0A170NBJ0_9CLOT|nr:cell wall-binding repeat-containing protein [Clostridium ljungdahlii]OAA83201.1 N-acetylmuramoyl-L-alanine amidase LytC precursor [Clostridium ljungdahlii]